MDKKGCIHKNRKYQCSICHGSAVCLHNRRKYECVECNKDKFYCFECDRNYASKNTLKRHVKSKKHIQLINECLDC